MQLTRYSDYSLRVLIYLASFPDGYSSTDEISRAYHISMNHLMKVVHKLGKEGFIEVKRGRGGGIRLAKTPSEIRIGEVVRKTEPNFFIAECFNEAKSACPILPVCGLKGMLNNALNAFFAVLDQHTLAQVIAEPKLAEKSYQVLLQKSKRPAV